MVLPNELSNNIDAIKFSENGLFVLLISYCDNSFYLFSLKKNKVKISYKSETGFNFCGFGEDSQNIIFCNDYVIQIFSLKFRTVIETINLKEQIKSGISLGSELKKVIQNRQMDKLIAFDEMFVFEIA